MENYLVHKLDTSSTSKSSRLKASVRVNMDTSVAASRKEVLERMNIRMVKGAKKLTLPF